MLLKFANEHNLTTCAISNKSDDSTTNFAYSIKKYLLYAQHNFYFYPKNIILMVDKNTGVEDERTANDSFITKVNFNCIL